MSFVLQDVRRTLRDIVRAPVFFTALILTLAVGVGANTAIFSVVKTVILEPLPYPAADKILAVAENPWVPADLYLELKNANSDVFETVAAFIPEAYSVVGEGEPLQIQGARVTSNFFQIFRNEIIDGRGFSEGDGHPGTENLAVVSERLWQQRLGNGSRGRDIIVNDTSYHVVGFADRRFRQLTPGGTEEPELWLASEPPANRADGGANFVVMLARIREDATLAQAQAVFDIAMQRFYERRPDFNNPGWQGLQLSPIKDELVGDLGPALVLLQVSAFALLLIACVNVANLQQVRFSVRQRELAIRSSLGASKALLVRQLVTESVVLGVLGGLIGFILMLFCLKMILLIAPSDIPRLEQIRADFGLFGFAMAISALAGVLFGVAPAMVATRRSLFEHLKEGGRTASGSERHSRVSQTLVVLEISLALVLLVGAGLLGRSFLMLTSQELGYRVESVYTIPLTVPENRYSTVQELEDFYRLVRDRITQVPGVHAAAVSNNLPIRRGLSRREMAVEGFDDPLVIQYSVVSTGYFETLNVPIVQGRAIVDTDRRDTPLVAVVDSSMAVRLWGAESPLGKRLRMVDSEQWINVVGVAANSRGNGLVDESRPGFYISNQQRQDTLVERLVGLRAVILVHGEPSLEALAPSLRQAIWDVDPRQPVPQVGTLSEIIGDESAPQRFRATLFGAFALLALILVVAGVYGIIAYLIGERTHELGIRKAMGASNADIVKRVLLWGIRLAVIGLVIGIVGVFFMNGFVSGMLFGVSSSDPATIVLSVVAIAAITFLACFIPALRISRMDPVVALRAMDTPSSSGPSSPGSPRRTDSPPSDAGLDIA